ncbi:MotA/TolQ/ExbB proton channel family protein [bacterium]|nr:MotA/TolQ/ExbB proton channel family protein [bacterium]
MVYYFNKGGFIMKPLLILLIIGIAFGIVKFWILLRSSINKKKFTKKILDSISSEKGLDGAIAICEKTRGPIAAVFHAGLIRVGKGLDAVERAIENTAAIEMSFLEKGMVWLSTIISVAPMLGFLGTVQGMIVAFDQIAKAGDIIPSDVAGGISIALLTTFFGLFIAIPMQIIYNYFVGKVDKTVIDMEDSANVLVENLLEMNIIKKEE